jgi:hypothetical protein
VNAATASEVTTDVPFRNVITLQLGDTARKVVLSTLALHAQEDGTGACIPGGLLASKTELSVARTRIAVRWLLENGYIRMPDIARPVYDVALSGEVRAQWRRSAPRRKVPERYLPNGPCGSWVGRNPLLPGWGTSPTPPRGMYVVYILFDFADVPCYVGCSNSFRARVEKHSEDKLFTTWQAAEAYGWTQALDLETRMIGCLKPYLNIAKVAR